MRIKWMKIWFVVITLKQTQPYSQKINFEYKCQHNCNWHTIEIECTILSIQMHNLEFPDSEEISTLWGIISMAFAKISYTPLKNKGSITMTIPYWNWSTLHPEKPPGSPCWDTSLIENREEHEQKQKLLHTIPTIM